jgi:hypothetical protein
MTAAPIELVEATLIQLRARMNREPEQAAALLVDPALHDPFDQLAEDSAVQRVQLPMRFRDLDAAHCPYLIWISQERLAERVVSRSVSLAIAEALGTVQPQGRRTVCAWLIPQRDVTPRELARALGAQAVLRDPGGRPRLVRYYDPRVADHLPRILGMRHLWRWLAGVDEWHRVAADGQLDSWLRPAAQASDPAAVVAADFWPMLERVGTINKLLSQSQSWPISDRQDLPVRLDRALQRATDCGLTAEQDQMVFAACAFTIREGFEFDPAVRQILSECRGGSMRFADAMSALNEEQLDAIAQSSDRDHSPRTSESTP